MHRPSSRGEVILMTAVLCAACGWLLLGDHGLAWRLGLGPLDVPLRIVAIFLLLSLLDKLPSPKSE